VNVKEEGETRITGVGADDTILIRSDVPCAVPGSPGVRLKQPRYHL
jgi:hypothetical protein